MKKPKKSVKAKRGNVKLSVNGMVVVNHPVKIEKRGNVTSFDFT